MEKPRESHEMKELKAFLEDAPEELKNLQVALLFCFPCCEMKFNESTSHTFMRTLSLLPLVS
jgi:hypothetical protein